MMWGNILSAVYFFGMGFCWAAWIAENYKDKAWHHYGAALLHCALWPIMLPVVTYQLWRAK